MNERIRLLAEQATSTLSVKHEGYRGKGYTEQVEFFDKEKFAELIVAECGHLMVDIMLHGGVEPEAGYDIMMKHFGVAE